MQRCRHGIYSPDDSELAWSCSLCYPAGHPETVSHKPIFNRRNAMTLTETGKLPKCPECDSILAVSLGGVCQHCGTQYEIDAPKHLRANNAQPGVCPECGSGVHYVGKTAREWVCADCDRHYTGPKKSEL